MHALLKLPYDNVLGNLLWMTPYLYPKEDLDKGIGALAAMGYWVSAFPEGDGLTFKPGDVSAEKILKDFSFAFPWMAITLQNQNEAPDIANTILQEQIVLLPVSRLEIDASIITETVCLFPPGYFAVEQINLKNAAGKPIAEKSNRIRDLVNEATGVSIEVFTNSPLLIIRDTISIEKYLDLSHQDDNVLIKEYAERADRLLDLMRFHRCDYTIPEQLPSKPGVWADRYSAALVYFPKYSAGFIQAREVEIKTFSMGIGMDFFNPGLINGHPLLQATLPAVGNIARHALRMNTMILEADNSTMKFVQIMTLLDYLGNPYEFENFKKFKGKLITLLTNDLTEYHQLSDRFRYLSADIRTPIIHNGQRIEDLFPELEKRKALFRELQHYVFTLIQSLIMSYDSTWEQYDEMRQRQQDELLKTKAE